MSTFDSIVEKRTSSPSRQLDHDAGMHDVRDQACARPEPHLGQLLARSSRARGCAPCRRARASRRAASSPRPRSRRSPSTRRSQPITPRPVISRSPPISSSEACSAPTTSRTGSASAVAAARARAARPVSAASSSPLSGARSRLDGHQQRDRLAQRGRGLGAEHLDLLGGVRGGLLERASGVGEVAAHRRATRPAPATSRCPLPAAAAASWSISACARASSPGIACIEPEAGRWPARAGRRRWSVEAITMPWIAAEPPTSTSARSMLPVTVRSRRTRSWRPSATLPCSSSEPCAWMSPVRSSRSRSMRADGRDVDATVADARVAVDRRHEPRAVAADDHVVADLDRRRCAARAPARGRPRR